MEPPQLNFHFSIEVGDKFLSLISRQGEWSLILQNAEANPYSFKSRAHISRSSFHQKQSEDLERKFLNGEIPIAVIRQLTLEDLREIVDAIENVTRPIFWDEHVYDIEEYRREELRLDNEWIDNSPSKYNDDLDMDQQSQEYWDNLKS